MSQNQVLQNHTSQDHPRKETMKAVVYEGNGILRLEERPIPHITVSYTHLLSQWNHI